MKDTDKITLTVGQLKKLVNETQNLNTYLVVYIDNQPGMDSRHKQITIDAANIKEALDSFLLDVDYTEILKIERMY